MIPMYALLWLLGCGGEVHEEHAHADPHEAGEGGPGELVIDEDARRDLRITTATARAGVGAEQVTVPGTLTVDEGRYAEVAAPVAGRIRALAAGPGDRVEAGAALVELESAELGRARAELLGARARASASQAAVTRKRSLSADTISTAELEAAEADARAAEATVDAAEAALAAYGAGSGAGGGPRLTLRAPLAGLVLSREARVGARVDPEHTLLRIADTGALWFVARASEREALRVAVGAEAELTFAALPNRTFPATVDRVGAEVDAASRTLPVRLTLTNPDGLLRPGMSGEARVPLTSTASAVAVPSAALQRLDDAWVVFVPLAEGRFAIRPVGRGRELGGEVELLSGLSAGEVVVLDGAFLLKAEAERREGGGDAHGH